MTDTPGDNGQPNRESPPPVALLSNLLEALYPDSDSLNPDILRLDDFKFRYQRTGLGPLAVAAIEQAQRMTRAIGNFEDVGLCEFHIGLIYLHWKDYRGAAQQFKEARHQWSFVNKTAAVCLAYFAEGLSHQYVHAYETALIRYGKVEQALRRIGFEPSPNNRDKFVKDLRKEVDEAQEQSREALKEQMAPDENSASEDETAPEDEAAPESETAVENEATVPPPILPLHPPSSQENLPIPGHDRADDQYLWYRVRIRRPDILFANIKEQGWLLVNRNMDNHAFKKEDLLVIASDDHDVSIVLEPHSSDSQHFHRICLARVAPDEISFTREGGRVQFSSKLEQIPVDYQDLFGYVVGLWLEAGDFEILQSR
ncbi:MAG: hypothetical protein GY803_23485 [Chloroflexi bacterium]|nr:hypothetical protein [Chloroflexota bacterium]